MSHHARERSHSRGRVHPRRFQLAVLGALAGFALGTVPAGANTVDFDDFVLDASGFYNGSDLAGDFTLGNNEFYVITPWSARYTTIRNANTMLVALEGNTTLSDGEKAAARGFA